MHVISLILCAGEKNELALKLEATTLELGTTQEKHESESMEKDQKIAHLEEKMSIVLEEKDKLGVKTHISKVLLLTETSKKNKNATKIVCVCVFFLVVQYKFSCRKYG